MSHRRKHHLPCCCDVGAIKPSSLLVFAFSVVVLLTSVAQFVLLEDQRKHSSSPSTTSQFLRESAAEHSYNRSSRDPASPISNNPPPNESLRLNAAASNLSDLSVRVEKDADDKVLVSSVVRTISDDFLELGNVCIKPMSKDAATITTSTEFMSDREADHPFFIHNSSDPFEFQYEYWGGLASDKIFTFVLSRKSRQEEPTFATASTTNASTDTGTLAGSIKRGTSLFATTHHCDNFFHLHNDFLLPLWLAKQRTNATRLYLLAGSRFSWSKRVPATDVILDRMFPNGVYYPLEEIMKGNGFCFERLVLSKLYTPKLRMNRPFYAHPGRFTSRWHELLVPEFRDFVLSSLLDVDDVRPPSEHHGTNSTTTAQRRNEASLPVLLWIPRGNHDSRRILNQDELIQDLNKHFQVQLFHFNTSVVDEKAPAEATTERTMVTEAVVKSQLGLIQSARVMIGVHGAGLTNAIYSNNNLFLVELVHGFAPNKRVFLNLASKCNIPYYAFDTQPYTANVSAPWDAPIFLPESVRKDFVEDLWNRYLAEEQQRVTHDTKLPKEKTSSPYNNHNSSNSIETLQTGECLFPSVRRKSLLEGKLTATNVSRCYLELVVKRQRGSTKKQRQWKTCSEYACQMLPLDWTDE